MGLLERFKQYIADGELLSKEDRVLLTVSGGVDSMVMLHLFVEAGYHIGVAHCNFQLRGREAEEDEALVQAEAERYAVPHYNKRFDTAAEMQRTGDSMEMTARRLRYAWFEQLREQHGYTAIAVAHHADDSIETFFINLLRGTGLRGLTGIHTQVGRVIRPLLFATRREIMEWAIARKIPFREDSSNRSTKYLRNKIRLGLLPRIREMAPKFTDLMRQNISRLTDAQLFIDHGIERIRRAAVEHHDGVDTLRLDRIDTAFPRNFVIYELLNSAYGFKGDVTDALFSALEGGEGTGKQFYSKSHVACIDRGTVVIAPIAEGDLCECTVEAGAARGYCGNSVLHIERQDIDLVRQFGVPENVALLDADTLRFPLRMRRWHEGDWFVPHGMTGRKKVSDFLIDQKVSRPEKERQFVLLSGKDVVWVIGRRTDDRFRITERTENVLRITREDL